MCKGVGRQVNYLIVEASTVGKGANAISNIHHYFKNYGSEETMFISMRTTAQDRIKTITIYGTYYKEQTINFTMK